MDVDDLDNHPKVNRSKKIHLCSTCGSGFAKPSGLIRHERIHTGEKPYKCDLCGASFSQSPSLKIHLRKHTGEKPFKCQHCGQAFAHSHRLKSHTLKFHTHTDHKCNICSLEFACNIDLGKHVASYAVCKKNHISDDQKDETAQVNLLTVSGNTTDCPQIQQPFDGQDHSRANNSECTPQQQQKQYCSPGCKLRENDPELSCECHVKMFSSIKDSKSHLKTTPISENFMCDVCGLFFMNPSSLNYHLKMHKKDKPYKCNLCNHSFAHVSNLKNHIIVHSGEKPFGCKICGTSFGLAGNLKIHMRTHTGEKPYSCELCGVRFKHSQALKVHSNVHRGSGIHACNFCGVAYSSFRSFNRHLQTHSEYRKSQGEKVRSSTYPIFVVQEASVNQGLRLASAGNKQPIEPVSLESLGDSLGKVISDDTPETEGEEDFRCGRNTPRNALESPSMNSLEAFPTFQDHYFSETENTTSVKDHEDMQTDLQIDIPESLDIELIQIQSPSTLTIESGNGALDLKDRMQANEKSMNEISRNCDNDVSASGNKSNYEIYPNSEKDDKNRLEEEGIGQNGFHVDPENNIMHICDEREKSEKMTLPSVLSGETEFLSNHMVKSASVLNQIDLDHFIYSPHLKGSMENYDQNISPVISTSNSISCFKSSLSYNLPEQVISTLDDSITYFMNRMKIYVPPSNVPSSDLMLIGEGNDYPEVNDAADASSNELGIMDKRVMSNIYSDDGRSSESIETFQSFTSMLELKQPDGRGDAYLNKHNHGVEVQSETEKTYFLLGSDCTSGAIETSVINQNQMILQNEIQRPNTACNVHDQGQILKFDKDKLSVKEESLVVSANTEGSNVMCSPHLLPDKNILSGSSDLFQTGSEESLEDKRLSADYEHAIDDTSVVFNHDKNIYEDNNSITYNTKVMENTYITEKSVNKNSSSQKIDFQLDLKNQEISAAFTSSDFPLKTTNNDIMLDLENKNANQNSEDATLSSHLKDKEKKSVHQISQGTEDKDVRGTKEEPEKQLKCVNCPLGLFDASVISVLCEDECFGDMLERHHHSEENNDSGKSVGSNEATMQNTSMLLYEQVENVASDFNKEDDKEKNTYHLNKTNVEALSTAGQCEKSASMLEEKDNENEKINMKNETITIAEITLQTDEEHGLEKIKKDENLIHVEQENMSKDSVHLNSADVKTFPRKQQIINDSTFLAQPAKDNIYSINMQESSFKAFSFEKLASVNVKQDCITSNMEKLYTDSLQSKVSLMQTNLAYSRSDLSRSRSKNSKTLQKKMQKISAKRFAMKNVQSKKRVQKKSTVIKYKYNQYKYRSDFAQKENLNEQLQIHVRQENGDCSRDHFNANLSHFIQHHCCERAHSREPSHVCPICHLFFLFHKTLDDCLKMPIGNTNRSIKLLEMTTTNSPSGCPHLGTHLSYFSFLSSTNSYADPQQKMDTHSAKSTIYLCQVCGESLSSLSLLNHHVRRHNKNSSYTCKICSAVFHKRSNLVKHRSVHSCEQPYKCKVCSRSFTQKANLNVHMRTHTGERPYSCKICKANFAHSQALKLHLRFHAKDTRFVCQDCGKGFVIKSALQKHLQSHTGEKPFVCHACDTRLSSQSSFSRHMKRHLGNDLLPFSCTLCSQRFAKSGHLKLHMKSHGAGGIKQKSE